MTMRTTNNGITVLSPAEGMRLTDDETVAEGEVYLARIASPDTWREVTEAEAADIEERIRKEAEAEVNGLNGLT